MNKKFLYALGVCLAVVMFAACGSDNDDGPTPPTPDNTETAKYDPSKTTAPDFLEVNAKTALDKFNSADHKPLVQLLNEVSDAYEDYSWPFDEDTFAKVARKLGAAAENYPTALYTYVYEYTVSLSRISGVYEPNEFTHKWRKSGDSKDFIARVPYNGHTAELKISGADGSWQYKSEEVYEDYYEKETNIVNLDIPKTLRMTLSDGSTTLMDFTVKTDFVEGRSINASVNGKAMNLTIQATVKGDDTYVSEASKVLIDSYQLSNVTAIVKGRRFCSPQQWDDYSGQIFDSCETTAYAANGAVRIEAKCSKLQSVIDCLDDYYSSGSAAKEAASFLNANIENEVYFNGYSSQVARIGWEAEIAYKSYYYEEWEVVPTITFKGESTYSFEEYFNNRTFGGVVSSFNSLIKSYRKLWK